ncbi:diguanylate cyclase [Planctomycetota bacterium]|nr:diguanylate cyclase [Planctomycetota bacterium]
MSKRAKLLVIDDSEMTHQLIRAHLKSLPVKIYLSNNGLDGFEKAMKIKPDVLLLDVNMPGVNGFDICAMIKNETQLRDTRVIFLTGQDEIVDKVRGFDLGASDYVTKPFDPVELKMRVSSHLETKRLIDLLAREANLDSLTGLHNRKYFDERMDQEMHRLNRRYRELGLLCIDIDNFKAINDMYGHPVGDDVMRGVADLILKTGRRSDVVCRYGGDEFVMILPDTNAKQATRVGTRIVEVVREDDELPKLVEQGVTVSVGVAALLEGERADIKDFMKRADEALYISKRGGKDCVCVAKMNEWE